MSESLGEICNKTRLFLWELQVRALKANLDNLTGVLESRGRDFENRAQDFSQSETEMQNEIQRLHTVLQQERQTADMQASELESQVGYVSVDKKSLNSTPQGKPDRAHTSQALHDYVI